MKKISIITYFKNDSDFQNYCLEVFIENNTRRNHNNVEILRMSQSKKIEILEKINEILAEKNSFVLYTDNDEFVESLIKLQNQTFKNIQLINNHRGCDSYELVSIAHKIANILLEN